MKTLNIDRVQRGGAYNDILDACHALRDEYGSATNAAANMIRTSPVFRRAMRELAKRRKEQK